ncbi:lipocalin Can f 6.0101-like [Saccopteryx leptura]|uniref:lipocalin Can f 6.0101-like n=1 Tax=Saccopteryx leptura TaxID=249018 RepID=UPI00339CCD05
MKLLLLCLGLTLVCAHEGGHHEVVTSNFDMSKVSGEWYTIMVASDVREKIEENGNLRIFVENTQELANSSLLFTFQRKENEECVHFTILLHPTQMNGVYSTIYDGYDLFNMVEGDYNEYLINYVSNFKNDKETQYMELFGRKPDVSPKLKKRFEELCLKQGIPKENILDVTNADRCLHSRNGKDAQDSRQSPGLRAGSGTETSGTSELGQAAGRASGLEAKEIEVLALGAGTQPKLQKLEGFAELNISQPLEVGNKVYVNREAASRQEDERRMKKKAELIAAALQHKGKGKPLLFENGKKTGKGKEGRTLDVSSSSAWLICSCVTSLSKDVLEELTNFSII